MLRLLFLDSAAALVGSSLKAALTKARSVQLKAWRQ